MVQVQIYGREMLSLAGYKGDYESAPGPYLQQTLVDGRSKVYLETESGIRGGGGGR